jgi:hypothetical protein
MRSMSKSVHDNIIPPNERRNRATSLPLGEAPPYGKSFLAQHGPGCRYAPARKWWGGRVDETRPRNV